MHRREFLKSILAVPLVSPLALKAHSSRSSSELYLISDTPDLHLPLLLDESPHGNPSPGTFTFLGSHPDLTSISRLLTEKGWSRSEAGVDVAFSFTPLVRPARPSFTFVRKGRIHDIRSKKLLALWNRMNSGETLSTCLTTLFFQKAGQPGAQGKSVSIFANGRAPLRLSLERSWIKAFPGRGGHVVVSVEDGKARVVESSCRHQVCLAGSPVSRTDERIICAPNNFLLEVAGTGGVDTIIG